MVLCKTEGTGGFCLVRWLRGCGERTEGPGHGAWYTGRAQEMFAGVLILFITQANLQDVGAGRQP